MNENKKVTPLGNREMHKLPHPKRVHNENQLDIGLTEFGASLAPLTCSLMGDLMPTDQIIKNLRADPTSDFHEAYASFKDPKHLMSLDEILCAYRFHLHHSQIVSLNKHVVEAVSKDTNRGVPAEQFSLYGTEFIRYFYLEHQPTSSSQIMLPGFNDSQTQISLEGFYCMQYGQPHEAFRELHLMLIGSVANSDGFLNRCAYPVQLHITDEHALMEDILKAGVREPLLHHAAQYALKTLRAYQKTHQNLHYIDEHDQVRDFSSLNREHRMKRTFNHYLMDYHEAS